MAGEDTAAASEVVAHLVRLAQSLGNPRSSDVSAGVEALLATLGTSLDVGRAYVFEHDAAGETTSNTFEWCAHDVPPQRATLQHVPIEMIAHWHERFEAGDAVCIEDVRALDPQIAPERETLLRQQIRSLLTVPLRVSGRTTGFLGLDDVRGPRAWPSMLVTLLQVAAALIGTSLTAQATEQARQSLDERLRAVANQVPGTLFRFEHDPDGARRFTYAGPRFEALLGVEAERLADDATLALERIHSGDLEAFTASLEHSRQTLTRWEQTFRLVDAKGQLRHLLGRADPKARADGGVLWNGLLLDVSDLWQANEALARSEANLRSILEMSEDAVILIDTERRVLDLNRSARARAERVIGRALNVGDVVTEVITDPAFATDLDAAFRGQATVHERPVVPPATTAPPYWAEVQVHPVRAEDGTVQSVVYRSADVTERRHANEAVARGTAFRQALLTLVRDLLAQEFGDDLYHQVLTHAVANVPGAEGGSIVVQRDDGRYHYAAAIGFDLEQLRSISYDPAELRQTRTTGATVLRPSYDNRHHVREVRDVLRSAGRVDDIQATLVAPVDVGGERLGYLHLDTFSDGEAFDEHAVELASLLAGAVGMALQRLRLEVHLHDERAKLAYLASHDVLTDLPNRVVLTDRLAQALVRGRRRQVLTALLFIDLDGFKAINDRFGHMTGDAVLRAVASRLRGAVRDEDTVARLGGDEFAVVAEGLRRAEDAAIVARKVVDALAAPFELDSTTVLIGGSIGISVAPLDADDGGTMMQNADLALYRVKREGRGGVAFYTTDLDERIRSQAALAEDLRRALLAGEEVGAVYQPIVRLEDATVLGMETLARWRHPERGEIAPAVFVPLAEEAGLIGALGRAVLQRACRDLGRWREAGVGHGWRCAVNVSAVQLRAQDFGREVEALVGESGLSLRDLELEVTESAVMDHAGPALSNLASLRAGGATVVIDDFGTGFSSLSRLRDLPVDAVKIDRSFVASLGTGTDAREAAIVDAVVALAKGLDLGTIAEGIETEAQRSAVMARGCRVGQGYLFAKPAPADVIVRRYRS